MTRFVVYYDKTASEELVKDIKHQFKKFLNPEDKAVYLPSENTFVTTVDETFGGGVITGPLTINKPPRGDL